MVVVAVAGGTGAVGRNIIEALISQGKHQVIILSRTVCHFFFGPTFHFVLPCRAANPSCQKRRMQQRKKNSVFDLSQQTTRM